MKGAKCHTPKCPIEQRPFPPGQHGRGRTRDTEYNQQLREKQKARRIYGVLESQFSNMFKKASRAEGITGETLLSMLETRLDNVVYRTGFFASRSQARQFVRHGHILVNGKKVTIPSYQVTVGEVIELREKSKQAAVVEHTLTTTEGYEGPAWLEIDINKKSVKMLEVPVRDQIDIPVQEQQIVELYSK